MTEADAEDLRRFVRKVWVVLGVVGALWALTILREFVVYLLIALVLSAAMTPAVEAGERRGIPRPVSVLAIVLAGLLGLTGLGLAVVPAVISQGEQLIRHLPDYMASVPARVGSIPRVGPQLQQQLTAAMGNLSGTFQTGLVQGVQVAVVAASSLANLVLIALITMFMILDAPTINRTLLGLLPARQARLLEANIPEIGDRLAGYVTGQGIISGVLAVAGVSILLALRVPYALLLGVILGIVSILPMVGGLLGVLPAVAVAFFVSPLTALWAFLALFGVVQGVGNFLAPMIFQRSVNIHPLTVLLALTLGVKLGGLGGAVVAVPVAAAIQVLVVNLYLKPKAEAEAGAGS